jgi:hypothetical protein
MSERKSPTESATLYKVGTKKNGNDGNVWIVSENINNVKRWKLFRKPSTKKSSTKKSSKKKSSKKHRVASKQTIKKRPKRFSQKGKYPPFSFYDLPKIKQNNWIKWLELLNTKQKDFVNKIRNSYTMLQDIDITPIEVILPLSESNMYWIDYPWDYAENMYPDMLEDGKTYLIFIYKLDADLHVIEIFVQHVINRKDKEKFIEFSKKYFGSKMIWSGKNKDSIRFII